jgi:hypothetical protein
MRHKWLKAIEKAPPGSRVVYADGTAEPIISICCVEKWECRDPRCPKQRRRVCGLPHDDHTPWHRLAFVVRVDDGSHVEFSERLESGKEYVGIAFTDEEEAALVEARDGD